MRILLCVEKRSYQSNTKENTSVKRCSHLQGNKAMLNIAGKKLTKLLLQYKIKKKKSIVCLGSYIKFRWKTSY